MMSFREHRKNRGREQKREFVKRLQYAMNWAGVSAMELSRRMLQYEQYPEYMDALQIKHLDERNKACNDIAASRLQLITDLRDPDKTMPDSLTIQSLSMALGCSADYLLGIIDVPTHEIKTVQEITHLSVETVQKMVAFRFDESSDDFLGFLFDKQQEPREDSSLLGDKTYFEALVEMMWLARSSVNLIKDERSVLNMISGTVVKAFERVLVQYVFRFRSSRESRLADNIIEAYHADSTSLKIGKHRSK